MPDQLTKHGALKISTNLDRLATLFMSEADKLGITEKIARDFALRCDILSDHIEKKAGVERTTDGSLKDPELSKYASVLAKKAADSGNWTMQDVQSWEFDPSEIGQRSDVMRNEDEPYMDCFKQDEFDQLRQVQQGGMFSNAKAASALIAKMAKLLSDKKIQVPVVVG